MPHRAEEEVAYYEQQQEPYKSGFSEVKIGSPEHDCWAFSVIIIQTLRSEGELYYFKDTKEFLHELDEIIDEKKQKYLVDFAKALKEAAGKLSFKTLGIIEDAIN